MTLDVDIETDINICVSQPGDIGTQGVGVQHVRCLSWLTPDFYKNFSFFMLYFHV